jgi:hypothetical protein
MFMGKGEFVWFTGVVEDRTSDPYKLGRCKVRCLGFHTDDTTQLPTADLPWASMMMPITSASMQGVGETPLGPIEGTWVVGFFRDGAEAQDPVVMGTIGGIPESTSTPGEGFADPYGINPTTKRGTGHGLNEADTNRLARNDSTQPHTIKTARINNVEVDIPLPNKLGLWDEKTTPADPVYPFNHVTESESGHIEEIDDTPGLSRTLKWHRSGTFDEVHPDGSKVTKIVSDSYEIVFQNKHILIKGTTGTGADGQYNGNLYVTILGDVYENIQGNVEREIGGSIREIVKGNYTMAIAGDYDVTVGGHYMKKVGGDNTEHTTGTYNNTVKGGMAMGSTDGQFTLHADNNVNIVSNDAKITTKSKTGTNITSTANVTVTGAQIQLNP